jgi:surface carbohydrate biosynthesis protein
MRVEISTCITLIEAAHLTAVKIALVVDNPKRDLAGMALLAHELLKLGAQPYLVPMYQQGYDVPLLQPDAVVVNYARPTNRELLLGYRDLGVATIVMDTEGGVLSEEGSDSPENWARLFKENGLNRCVDRYLFWGPRLRNAFSAAGALADEQLEVTGCPRYDFCHPRWSRLLDYPVRGFVLVNTNFSAINPRFTASAESEMAVFAAAGWGREYTAALFDDWRTVFPRYLDAIAGIATRNPRRKVIVRPHPFENSSMYRKRFERHPNVAIEPAGSVLNAIQAADCVIHLNCGSAVETLLLGKTPIALEYLNTERMRSHSRLPSLISCPATDEQDLDRLLVSAAERSRRWQPQPLLERYITPWFHRIDGNAAYRVAAAVVATIRSRSARPRRSVRNSMAGGVRNPTLAQRAQGLASNMIGSRLTSELRSSFAPARREKQIDSTEVTALLGKIGACDHQTTAACAAPVRHPLTRLSLTTLSISRSGAA